MKNQPLREVTHNSPPRAGSFWRWRGGRLLALAQAEKQDHAGEPGYMPPPCNSGVCRHVTHSYGVTDRYLRPHVLSYSTTHHRHLLHQLAQIYCAIFKEYDVGVAMWLGFSVIKWCQCNTLPAAVYFYWLISRMGFYTRQCWGKSKKRSHLSHIASCSGSLFASLQCHY